MSLDIDARIIKHIVEGAEAKKRGDKEAARDHDVKIQLLQVLKIKAEQEEQKKREEEKAKKEEKK